MARPSSRGGQHCAYSEIAQSRTRASWTDGCSEYLRSLVVGSQDTNPGTLVANGGRVFQGAWFYGHGFLLSDTRLEARSSGRCTTDPKESRTHIYSYLGGEEVNADPLHRPYRYVINFGTLTLEEASEWPELIRIVEQKVKPERDQRTNNAIALRQKQYWWRFRSDTPNLFHALKGLSRCMIHSQVSSHLAFAFTTTTHLFAHTANIFAFDSFSSFRTCRAGVTKSGHASFASSMKDDMRYTPVRLLRDLPIPRETSRPTPPSKPPAKRTTNSAPP